MKPIAFGSRYLNESEQNYSIGELELLAVVWGLEKFRFYLYGKKVFLYTDHQALEPLIKRNRCNRQYSARLTRWLDRLAHFDIAIQHIAGSNLKFTDFLSRNPVENATTEDVYEPKRNTYHNRGEFFWTKQTETETPEDFWRRLIEIEKECAFEGITAEDLLISKFMTAITDTKLRDKLMKEKKLELKKTIEMIKQNTYERKTGKIQYRKH